MSIYCGNCGNLIFVSNHGNTTTTADDPYFKCDQCGYGDGSRLGILWGGTMKLLKNRE